MIGLKYKVVTAAVRCYLGNGCIGCDVNDSKISVTASELFGNKKSYYESTVQGSNVCAIKEVNVVRSLKLCLITCLEDCRKINCNILTGNVGYTKSDSVRSTGAYEDVNSTVCSTEVIFLTGNADYNSVTAYITVTVVIVILVLTVRLIGSRIIGCTGLTNLLATVITLAIIV